MFGFPFVQRHLDLRDGRPSHPIDGNKTREFYDRLLIIIYS